VLDAIHGFQQAHPDQWQRCPGSHHAIDTEITFGRSGDRRIGRAGGVFNAAAKFGTVADYERFSRPMTGGVFDAWPQQLTSCMSAQSGAAVHRPFKDLHAPGIVQYSLQDQRDSGLGNRGQFRRPSRAEWTRGLRKG